MPKWETFHWRYKDDIPELTGGRLAKGAVAAAGALGCAYLAVRGVGSRFLDAGGAFFGAGVFMESVLANKSKNDIGEASNNAYRTRVVSRGVKLFATGLFLIGVADIADNNGSANQSVANSTLPAGTAPQTPNSQEGHCGIIAPIPDGQLTGEEYIEVKELQSYMSGLELPNGDVLPVISPEDNNFKSEDSQLSKNINAFQIYYGLDSERPWNEATCQYTPFWQAE